MGDTEATFGFVISLANVFGLFPVSRKKVAGREKLCFKWRSLQTIYWMITFVSLCLYNIVLDLLLLIQYDIGFVRLGNLVMM